MIHSYSQLRPQTWFRRILERLTSYSEIVGWDQNMAELSQSVIPLELETYPIYLMPQRCNQNQHLVGNPIHRELYRFI